MIRKATALWVCLSNLVFAGVVLRHLSQERSLYGLLKAQMPWSKYTLPILIVVILLAGVVLELFNSKVAFFVNAGFFLVVAGYAFDVLIHASSEPEARIFGWLLAIPASLVLGVDILLYSRKTRARRTI